MRGIGGLTLGLVLLGVLFVPFAAVGNDVEPDPSYGPQDLWASVDVPSGWGFTQATITNPGPTITVAAGEFVQLRLFSADTDHEWALDENGDRVWNPGELRSPRFGVSATPTTFDFNAPTTPGTYSYFCSVHGWTLQRGDFVVTSTGNAPPTVTLTNPDGAVERRWTGGAVKRLAWTMADPDGPPSQLAVWLNYSYNSGASTGTIAGPPTIPFGATFYDWTVPLVDAPDMTVHVEVVDPQGARGTDARQVPIVDSTPPSVVGTTPSEGVTGVSRAANVVITFSEPMDRPATEAPSTVGLQEVGSSAWIAVTVAWNPQSTVLTLDPAPMLNPTTQHRLVVNTTARDQGDPGLSMAAPFTATFTTGDAADVTNPTVTITSPQDGAVLPGPTVTATGTASDDVAVQRVEVSLDGTTWVLATGTTSWSAALTLAAGENTIHARATDTSGNTATVAITVTVEGVTDVGPGPALLFAAIVLVVLALVALVFLLWRRRARGSPPAGPG